MGATVIINLKGEIMMNIKNKDSEIFRYITPLTENITRVVCTFSKEKPRYSMLIAEDFKQEHVWKM